MTSAFFSPSGSSVRLPGTSAFRDRDVPTLGPETGFIENVEAAFGSVSGPSSVLGMQDMFAQVYREQMDTARRLGYAPEDNLPDVQMPYGMMGTMFQSGAGRVRDPYPEGVGGRADLNPAFNRMAEFWDEAPSFDGQLLTFRQMWEEAGSRLRALEEREANVRGRATGLGAIGSFVGGVAGSLTKNDPLNIATLGIGGGGRQLSTRLISEGGIGMFVEGVNQASGVREVRAQAGLDNDIDRALAHMMMAGVGSAAFRGVIEGAPGAFRATERIVAPGRAARREANDGLNRLLKALDDYDPAMTDDILLGAVRNMTADSGAVRAAEYELTAKMATDRATPPELVVSGERARQAHMDNMVRAYVSVQRAPDWMTDMPLPSAPRHLDPSIYGAEITPPREGAAQATRHIDERIATVERALEQTEARLSKAMEGIVERRLVEGAPPREDAPLSELLEQRGADPDLIRTARELEQTSPETLAGARRAAQRDFEARRARLEQPRQVQEARRDARRARQRERYEQRRVQRLKEEVNTLREQRSALQAKRQETIDKLPRMDMTLRQLGGEPQARPLRDVFGEPIDVLARMDITRRAGDPILAARGIVAREAELPALHRAMEDEVDRIMTTRDDEAGTVVIEGRDVPLNKTMLIEAADGTPMEISVGRLLDDLAEDADLKAVIDLCGGRAG